LVKLTTLQTVNVKNNEALDDVPNIALKQAHQILSDAWKAQRSVFNKYARELALFRQAVRKVDWVWNQVMDGSIFGTGHDSGVNAAQDMPAYNFTHLQKESPLYRTGRM
jgi:hypothetical protein